MKQKVINEYGRFLPLISDHNLTKKSDEMSEYVATPMSLSELANAYDVSNKIMNKWLEPHKANVGKRVGLLYTPKQVMKIFDLLGYPPYLDIK